MQTRPRTADGSHFGPPGRAPQSCLFAFIRFLGRLTIAAAWLFALALAAWNLARVYPGDRWLPVRLGNFFAPWLFMALAPALLVALLGRRRWLASLVLLLGLVFGLRYWPLLAPRLPLLRAQASETQLSVMTFNVHYANRDAAAIAQLIRTEAPDVIAMQELTRELADSLQAELGADYPYFLGGDAWGLTALMSRYPLTEQPVPPEVWHTRRATVETPAGPLSIWSVHLSTALAQRRWELQKEMAAVIAREIDATPGPSIVLGDFNTTDQTENYRLIAGRLTDVHWAVGQGFAFTFPDMRRYTGRSLVPGPLVRIDHIFVSRHFIPQEIHVAPSGYGSDHRPVIATLRFK
jgi:vancomycin resistance protein VanJ